MVFLSIPYERGAKIAGLDGDPDTENPGFSDRVTPGGPKTPIFGQNRGFPVKMVQNPGKMPLGTAKGSKMAQNGQI